MKTSTAAELKAALSDNKIVVADFFATWCPPCKMLGPVIEELSTKVEEDTTVLKIDVDMEKELAGSYNVRSVPTIIFFKEGIPLKVIQGYTSLNSLFETIAEVKAQA